MLEMARKQLLPAVNAYMSEVANTAASKLEMCIRDSLWSAQRPTFPAVFLPCWIWATAPARWTICLH